MQFRFVEVNGTTRVFWKMVNSLRSTRNAPGCVDGNRHRRRDNPQLVIIDRKGERTIGTNQVESAVGPVGFIHNVQSVAGTACRKVDRITAQIETATLRMEVPLAGVKSTDWSNTTPFFLAVGIRTEKVPPYDCGIDQ